MNTHRFAITGMTCQACATRLEKVLNKKDGIGLASVNFASETLTIQTGDSISVEQISTWINKTGFQGELIIDTPLLTDSKAQLPWRLVMLWVLSLPFWVGMVGMMIGNHALMLPSWVQFILATVVQFGFGYKFYQGAYKSIRGRLANMDVLVALGTTAIWGYSSYAWWVLASHDVYFEASVMVIAFISLGKFLEQRTKKHGLDSLSALVALVPTQVLKQQDATWQLVATFDINIGDILQARHGDKVAVDGVVIDGVGYVNEAHLTGESEFLPKLQGDTVLAGSMVADGSFTYQATAVGSDTVLSDMIHALDTAQGSKAPIARLADKVAGIFVPVVVAIAMITLGVTYVLGYGFDVALLRAVSVLVIACPCALGLATPAAIMAGMGVASRHGVRFQDAASLETAGKIDSIIFDKTGTLTQGKPSVHAVAVANKNLDADEILAITASLEKYANHPLAQAIVQQAVAKKLNLSTVNDVRSIAGQGMKGRVLLGGVWQTVTVGSLEFVGMTMEDLTTFYKQPNDMGDNWHIASLVAVAIEGVPLAVYALFDELGVDSLAVIQALQQEGVQVSLLSGDRHAVVTYVAQELGVDQAIGQLTPADKANFIKQLQLDGQIVAMVGDGINDAPAIAQADIGMAVHGASDITKNTADVQLVGNTLIHAYYAYKIARLTLNTIKQNLFFAFIYNVIGIPLAILGVLTPVLAGLAMALSSISVLINALRLKHIVLNNTVKNKNLACQDAQ